MECQNCHGTNLRCEVELQASPQTFAVASDGDRSGSLTVEEDLLSGLVGRLECDDCGETVADDMDVQVG